MIDSVAPALHTAAEGRSRIRGVLWMCLAVLLWAVVEVIGEQVPAGYSAYEVVWVRYATHLVFMLMVLAPRYKLDLIRTGRPGMQVLRGLLMLGMPVFFLGAVSRMSVGDALSVFWVSPLMVMMLSWLLLGERASWRLWSAAMIGFAGVLIMLQPGGGILKWASLLPLGMAFCFGLYQVMTRMMRAENTVVNLFYTAFCVFVPLSWGLRSFWRTPSAKVALLMLSIGLVGLLVLLAIDRAYHLAPASVLAPFAYLQPILLGWGSLLAVRSLPNPLTILGGLIVVGSASYVFRLLTRTGDLVRSSEIRAVADH